MSVRADKDSSVLHLQPATIQRTRRTRRLNRACSADVHVLRERTAVSYTISGGAAECDSSWRAASRATRYRYGLVGGGGPSTHVLSDVELAALIEIRFVSPSASTLSVVGSQSAPR